MTITISEGYRHTRYQLALEEFESQKMKLIAMASASSRYQSPTLQAFAISRQADVVLSASRMVDMWSTIHGDGEL